MGQYVSCDTAPLEYNEFIKSISLSKNIDKSKISLNESTLNIRHNLKIFQISNNQTISSLVINSDLEFKKDSCYIIIHFYILSNSSENEDFEDPDIDMNEDDNNTRNQSSWADKVSNLEIDNSNSLKRNRSTNNNNEFNNSFSLDSIPSLNGKSLFNTLNEQLLNTLQSQSLHHPFSLPAKFHTIHLFNGIHASAQTQANAISRSLYLERLFMELNRSDVDRIIRDGNSVPLNANILGWEVDIPSLSNVSKSNSSQFMYLYNTCDLLRILINDYTSIEDFHKEKALSIGNSSSRKSKIEDSQDRYEVFDNILLDGLSMHQLFNLPTPKKSLSTDGSTYSKSTDHSKQSPKEPISKFLLRFPLNIKSDGSHSARFPSESKSISSSGSLSARISRKNSLLLKNEKSRGGSGAQSGRSQLTHTSQFTEDYTDDDFSSTFSTPRSNISSPVKKSSLLGNVRTRSNVDDDEIYVTKSARSSISENSPRSSRSSSSNRTPRDFLVPKLGKLSFDFENTDNYPDSARSENDDFIPDPSMSGAELVMYYRKRLSNIFNDCLFVGSDWVAKNKDQLKNAGVTHIINAAKLACGIYFPDDFEYLALSLYDAGTESILGTFFTVIEFIENAFKQGGKVLVHCYEGVSRSTTLAISYLMWKTRLGFNEVMEDVKKKRGSASPNAGFIVQLLQWEKILKDTESNYLFRISPLNDQYYEHKQLVPYLCNVNVLDSRTCFILLDIKNNHIYLWEGQQSVSNILEAAKTFSEQLKNYLCNDMTKIIIFPESNANQHPIFLRGIKNVKSFLNSRRSGNEEVYPELEFLDSEREITSSQVDEDSGEMRELENSLESNAIAKLFEYPNWESIENFDSDDLYDDAVYVLKPLDRHSTIFVWIGSSVELDLTAQTFGHQVAQEFMEWEGIDYRHVVIVEDGEEEGTGIWDYFTF